MPRVAPRVLDAGLNAIRTTADRVVACSSYPASYAAVAGVTLASKAVTAASFTGPENSVGGYGRRTRLSAFSDGVVSVSGIARYVAIVDDAPGAQERLIVQAFTEPTQLTVGQPWRIAQDMEIEFPAWPDEGDPV